jgi:hypothetical protein
MIIKNKRDEIALLVGKVQEERNQLRVSQKIVEKQ